MTSTEPHGFMPGTNQRERSGAIVASIKIPPEACGSRLDAFLAEHLPQHSRSRLRVLIEQGLVTVDGVPAKPSMKLKGSEVVAVTEPPVKPTELVPQPLPLVIRFEDEDLIVLEKPADLVVHPGAGHDDGTLANALMAHVPELVIAGEARPGIVHRLDKETSGLLVVAKNEFALRSLSAAFKAREVEKRYIAFCLGKPKQASFELITGHRRANGDRRRFTTKLAAPEVYGVSGGIRRAHSRFTVLRTVDGVSQVEVELLTGRTHQIRAHLADIGHPLLMDSLYGGGRAEQRLPVGDVRRAVGGLHRQALHAAVLGFRHPRTGESLRFEARLPDDLLAIEAALQLAGKKQ